VSSSSSSSRKKKSSTKEETPGDSKPENSDNSEASAQVIIFVLFLTFISIFIYFLQAWGTEELCAAAWDGTDISTFREKVQELPLSEINGVNFRGHTPLFCAAYQVHHEHLIALLKVPGIEVNKGDTTKGNSALHGMRRG
jgi:hypothetical protein